MRVKQNNTKHNTKPMHKIKELDKIRVIYSHGSISLWVIGFYQKESDDLHSAIDGSGMTIGRWTDADVMTVLYDSMYKDWVIFLRKS